MDGSRGYGKNRMGELMVYKYICGVLDIDRTVLISFLLFLSSNAELPSQYRLSQERLDEILDNCGYSRLDTEDDFDWFVTELLENPHPMDFLTEVMVEFAKHEKNSFLYHVYGNSVHYEEELVRTLLPSDRKDVRTPDE